MQIKNALQIRKGDGDMKPKGFNTFTQPIQFLPKNEKDEDWCMHNMDWLEWQGVKQLRANARRFSHRPAHHARCSASFPTT